MKPLQQESLTATEVGGVVPDRPPTYQPDETRRGADYQKIKEKRQNTRPGGEKQRRTHYIPEARAKRVKNKVEQKEA